MPEKMIKEGFSTKENINGLTEDTVTPMLTHLERERLFMLKTLFHFDNVRKELIDNQQIFEFLRGDKASYTISEDTYTMNFWL